MKKTEKTLIFLTLYLAYTSIYIARINLSVAGPILKDMHVLDSSQIGLLGSCFFVVYAVGRIINGTLSDNAPPRVMLGIGLCFTGISNCIIGFLPPFAAILALWIINAYAQSMLWSSVLCSVSAIYDKGDVKKKSSVIVTSVASGNILSIIINSALITEFDVGYAFFIPGLITLVLGILTFAATYNIKNISKSVSRPTGMVQLLRSKELLIMNVAAMFHGVMKENISLWMAVYIVDTYFVDIQKSSYYILLIPTIGFIGRILYPFLYKFFKYNEYSVSLAGFIVCAAASGILCIKRIGMFTSVLALGIIYTAVSVINTSIVSIYPISYSKSGHTAAVSGITDFSTYLGAGISSAVYGYIIKSFGYLPMFISWAIISALSVLIIAKIKKNQNNI